MKGIRRIILNVDDNSEMLKLLEHAMNLTRVIKGYAWKVFSTADVNAAVAFIENTTQLDPAVFNVRMPIMNGYELANKLRDRFQYTPIIFQSGSDREACEQQTAAINNAKFMPLPFDLKEFSLCCEKKLKK